MQCGDQIRILRQIGHIHFRQDLVEALDHRFGSADRHSFGDAGHRSDLISPGRSGRTGNRVDDKFLALHFLQVDLYISRGDNHRIRVHTGHSDHNGHHDRIGIHVYDLRQIRCRRDLSRIQPLNDRTVGFHHHAHRVIAGRQGIGKIHALHVRGICHIDRHIGYGFSDHRVADVHDDQPDGKGDDKRCRFESRMT